MSAPSKDKNQVFKCENELLCEKNRGGFSLSIVAEFNDIGPVKYIIRIAKPNGESADFVSSLDGFKKFGELLVDLHSFAEEKLYATNREKLKEILTAESIKTYVAFKKSGTFKK
jgi:hypothetical protein